MKSLHGARPKPMAALRGPRLIRHLSIGPTFDRRSGGASMTDIITLVLGTGGILLMIAYATLCDRV